MAKTFVNFLIKKKKRKNKYRKLLKARKVVTNVI